MKNNKILLIAVIVLLLSNIALVAFMLTNKSRKEDKRYHRGEPFEMMAKELNMTEQQRKEYKQMKEEHMNKVRPLFDSLRASKSAFFALAKDSAVSDSTITAYSLRIAENQVKLDRTALDHFVRVRKIFTPDQQPKFDTFMQKMLQRGRRDSADKKKPE